MLHGFAVGQSDWTDEAIFGDTPASDPEVMLAMAELMKSRAEEQQRPVGYSLYHARATARLHLGQWAEAIDEIERAAELRKDYRRSSQYDRKGAGELFEEAVRGVAESRLDPSEKTRAAAEEAVRRLTLSTDAFSTYCGRWLQQDFLAESPQ